MADTRETTLSVLLALLLCLAMPASAQTVRYYDSSGRAIGRSDTRSATTRYYDSAGRSQGRAVVRGRTVYRYDSSGRPIGRDVLR